jgi:hypothetical protein
MGDKTRLEEDIERQQLKRPRGVYLLIILLSVSLGVLGAYTLKVKKELSTKQQEIILIKKNCNIEKTELMNELRECREAKEGE